MRKIRFLMNDAVASFALCHIIRCPGYIYAYTYNNVPHTAHTLPLKIRVNPFNTLFMTKWILVKQWSRCLHLPRGQRVVAASLHPLSLTESNYRGRGKNVSRRVTTQQVRARRLGFLPSPPISPLFIFPRHSCYVHILGRESRLKEYLVARGP